MKNYTVLDAIKNIEYRNEQLRKEIEGIKSGQLNIAGQSRLDELPKILKTIEANLACIEKLRKLPPDHVLID